MKFLPDWLKMPKTESPMWQLRTIPVIGWRVMIESVAEPFSSFLWTAWAASSSGLSTKYSSFSASRSSLTAAMSLLAQTPESMPILLQPPTPSATMSMFLETQRASSPPFQTLSGCGASPQASLNSYLLSPAWLLVKKIFFLASLLILANIQI